jgi:Transposase IS116/IS110/IS902 family
MVQMKNRVSGLLMEIGVEYNKQRLHRVSYFRELLSTNTEVHPSIRPLLKLSRETIERYQKTEYALVSSLQRDPMLADRIKRLRTVPGVGPITALAWALEIGDVSRFRTIKQAISYCGLCGDERSSADKAVRMPLSKQHNKHIQRTLIEAAKLAARQNHELAVIYDRGRQKGNGNRATLAVTRKMVAYLLAGSATERLRSCGKTQERGSISAAQTNRMNKMRRLPGPAFCRLSEGDYPPEALYELFRDWQRTPTQSSVTALRSLRYQMDVWFCRVQEPMPRGIRCALNVLDRMTCTLSRACLGHPCLRLTDDLHGYRQTGSYLTSPRLTPNRQVMN